jgi:hypothetical protein
MSHRLEHRHKSSRYPTVKLTARHCRCASARGPGGETSRNPWTGGYCVPPLLATCTAPPVGYHCEEA